MKILLLVDDYLPSTKSAPLMMKQLAGAFLRQEHEVMIVTPAGRWQRSRLSVEDGIPVFRFPSGRLKNVNMVSRTIHETLLSAVLIWYIVFRRKLLKCDLVVYYSPSIFWGTAVALLRAVFHAPSYLILRDIFPQWAIDNKLLKNWSPITWYFRFFEWINYHAADRIGVQSEANTRYFRGKKAEEKVSVLYNWFDTNGILTTGSGLRDKLHWHDRVIFFYGGNIGIAQDMDNLMRLAKRLNDFPDAALLFVGSGDACKLIEARINEWQLTNTVLLPAVPQKEYFELLSQIDVGLFSLAPEHRTHNFPGKLLGYMAYGKPILGSVNKGNDLKEVFVRYRIGLISDNPDDETLFENARALLTGSALRRELGENGRRCLAEKFNVDKNARIIIDQCIDDLGKVQ